MQDQYYPPGALEADEPGPITVDVEALKPGTVVVIRAFDGLPEHLFRIEEVYDDCVGGHSLDGPLFGEYGEPPFDLIKAIHAG